MQTDRQPERNSVLLGTIIPGTGASHAIIIPLLFYNEKGQPKKLIFALFLLFQPAEGENLSSNKTF